uniref:AlNc14C555G12145 protein n=1 Tax=Albugo laibachii Nc14 TaxID=890382 RepID=F0X151_9STRA|nr:AlNc14C555G12145 [Albugo laibachii Nc14]|eukprot:CCA27507.1 AlNc14C555G12145 [Albugo laibachii Nc14]
MIAPSQDRFNDALVQIYESGRDELTAVSFTIPKNCTLIPSMPFTTIQLSKNAETVNASPTSSSETPPVTPVSTPAPVPSPTPEPETRRT